MLLANRYHLILISILAFRVIYLLCPLKYLQTCQLSPLGMYSHTPPSRAALPLIHPTTLPDTNSVPTGTHFYSITRSFSSIYALPSRSLFTIPRPWCSRDRKMTLQVNPPDSLMLPTDPAAQKSAVLTHRWGNM